MSEGQGGSFDKKFPELPQSELRQIVPNLHQRLKKATEYLRSTDLVFSSEPKRMDFPRGERAGYEITNSPSLEQDEITVTKHYDKRRPNLFSESIRFKFGGPVTGDTVFIEYSRTLKNGASRTFSNNLPAVRFSEIFLDAMGSELQNPPTTELGESRS